MSRISSGKRCCFAIVIAAAVADMRRDERGQRGPDDNGYCLRAGFQ